MNTPVANANPAVSLNEQLDRIENLLEQIVQQKPTKNFYSTREVAKMLSRAEFTVREWARNGRIWASKKECGRGNTKEWMISHEEVERIQNEALLPR
jgi:transposase